MEIRAPVGPLVGAPQHFFRVVVKRGSSKWIRILSILSIHTRDGGKGRGGQGEGWERWRRSVPIVQIKHV